MNAATEGLLTMSLIQTLKGIYVDITSSRSFSLQIKFESGCRLAELFQKPIQKDLVKYSEI